MKKLYFLLLISSLVVLSTSCDDNHRDCSDMTWDFVVYDITIGVSDADGNDLLNPATENYIPNEDILVRYKGVEYPVIIPTRAYPPRWNGLRRGYNESLGKYCLLFGEFGPTNEHHDEKFVIEWGDGSKDEVKFDMYITWKNCNPTVHRKISLNNTVITTPERYVVGIVK